MGIVRFNKSSNAKEETLEQTTNATNEERAIGLEDNIEATKDDDTLGSKPKPEKEKDEESIEKLQQNQPHYGLLEIKEPKDRVHGHKGHWIDESWQLQKRVLNFVHIPPPRRGLEIANAIWRNLEDWGIESKIHTIYVDNASVNELFWTATHIVSGSDYPTSNLFLNEVSRVKVLLDKKILENDIFIWDIVARMKVKFDKYWGETNLLMSIAIILDPMCNLRALEFCFPRLYSSENVERQIAIVRKTLYELYYEYADISNMEGESIGEGKRNKLSNPDLTNVETQCGWSEYAEYLKSMESIQLQKSKPDLYREENCYIFEKDKKDGKDFDVLE
ncbi:Zinc finger BED domain-containing protein RICESLEEPER 1 [Sesamum alatum]|uniref:Zinc finger BED domain-containing protein RICESLEEPER 1 n=1 Tax=Sesamum alatum TaxID=300844 RepID=A0AAE2CKG9_9LAMI|nr:Zinc finger BED domain-containing protein RICESLEEPER 1 [Sesamum alatum]